MSAAPVSRLMAGLGCLARLRAAVSLPFAFAGTAMTFWTHQTPVTAWPIYARNNEQIWGVKPAYISVITDHDRPPRRPLERSP
jgi:hypothetical protein